jgi:putative oxidoreductase
MAIGNVIALPQEVEGAKHMSVDLGIFLLRVIFGIAMAAHATQKLFGWFGGHGLKGTGGFFESLGFRPGVAFAAAAGLSELGGGVLLALGFFTPFGAAGVLAAMIVAMVSVHLRNGFFAGGGGIELPFLYAAAALALAFTGAGAFSFDALLGLTFLRDPSLVGGLVVLAVLGSLATLAVRRQDQKQASAA